MYIKEVGRSFFGLCTRTSTSVRRHCPTSAQSYSWTSACQQHHVLQLKRASCRAVRQHSVPCHLRVRWASQSTVDPDEVRRFQSLANKWWDEQGDFAALHSMNDLRVPFIRDILLSTHAESRPGKPLAGLRLLDVGCGGGLLTEPLGRLGADVLGIDPVEDSIRMGELHASQDPDLRESVRYRAVTLEELSLEEDAVFDGVVASEVVEHLADLDTFALSCAQVLKPGGSLFITTISKTSMSYGLAILAAERVLGIVPAGTHDWEKFITPVDLERLLESNGFSVESVRGMLFNPLSGGWSWCQSTSVNYALHAVKTREEEPAPGPSHTEAQTTDRDTPTTGHN